jgi:hypothetical protein
MDTQDSEEDFLFRESRSYPDRGAGAFPGAGVEIQDTHLELSQALTETRRSRRDPPAAVEPTRASPAGVSGAAMGSS